MSPPNWYPAPESLSHLRYWDGSQWTDHYALILPVPDPSTPLVDVQGHADAGILVYADADVLVAKGRPVAPVRPRDARPQVLPTDWRTIPPASTAPGATRSLRAGEVLIGLGALALAAAGFAFLRSIWSDIGLLGQSTVLTIIVLVQAAASMYAMPRIRSLGEALAASSAITLLCSALWGYATLYSHVVDFPLFMYILSAAHLLVFLAPVANRARAWGYTASVFIFVSGVGLLALPQPHLWAVALAACGLLFAKFGSSSVALIAYNRFVLVPLLRKEPARGNDQDAICKLSMFGERFSAFHGVLAILLAISVDVTGGDNVLFSTYQSITVMGFMALVALTGSTFLSTSYPLTSARRAKIQTLRFMVWRLAFVTFGLLSVYAISDSGVDFSLRLVLFGIGLAASALVFWCSPVEVVKYRKVSTITMVLLSVVQLGWYAVLVPSFDYVVDTVLVPSFDYVGDVLHAIGPGYLLLCAGFLILGASVLRRRPVPAFVGAACAALGWWVLLDTRLENVARKAPFLEIQTIPVALLLLLPVLAAYRAQISWPRLLLPAMLCVSVPSTLTALDSPVDLRFTILVAFCVLCLPLGFRFRLFALVVPPAGALLTLFVVRALGFLGDSWVTLALAAVVLLILGSFFEKTRDTLRAAGVYVSNLR